MKTIVEIPAKVPSNNGANGLLRMHWSKRGKLKFVWAMLFRSQTKNRHKGEVKVLFTHYYIGRPIEDADNLMSTVKIPLDALKEAGIIVDDKIKIIGTPEIVQVRVAKKEEVKTIITITDNE